MKMLTLSLSRIHMTVLYRCFAAVIILLFPHTLHAQSVDAFKKHVEYLASDALEGRGTGSAGIQRAAAYIAGQFNTIGLKAIDGESYFQHFAVPELSERESNVIGILPASQPTSSSILFTAHYDAYGIRKTEGEADTIYNGAQDNAVGVAALIEVARAFKKGTVPNYNLVFIATAAEEVGLYGSLHYVQHPVFPLEEVVLCLNLDGFNVSGEREDYFVMPRQGVDFIDEIESVASPLGWHYAPPDWVDGMNTSFDTAAFLVEGIPAFTLWTGNRLKGGERAPRLQFGRIHSPDDEINEYWNWDGVADHLALYQAIAEYFLNNETPISVTDRSLFERKND